MLVSLRCLGSGSSSRRVMELGSAKFLLGGLLLAGDLGRAGSTGISTNKIMKRSEACGN